MRVTGLESQKYGIQPLPSWASEGCAKYTPPILVQEVHTTTAADWNLALLIPVAGKWQAPMDGGNSEFPFAWLWMNEQLADVLLTVSFSAATDSQEACGLSSTNPNQALTSIVQPSTVPTTAVIASEPKPDGGRKKGQGASGKVSSNDNSNVSTSAVPCTKEYNLHSQLLSSTSAFFRASLTTEVGGPSKKARKAGTCRWQLQVSMSLEEADAIEAVLFSLYKPQEYGDDTSSDLLLRIMKVCKCEHDVHCLDGWS